MNKDLYLKERNELIEKGQRLIDEGKIVEFNEVKTKIEKLDSDYEEYTKKQANLNALQDNHKIIDIYNQSQSINIENGTVIDTFGNPINKIDRKSIFLNKSDKLSDRISINQENSILLEDEALGNIIKGVVTGKWDNPSLKNTVSTSGTSVLIPSILSSQIIDIARNISLFGAAGVPTVPMETNNITISKITQDPTFKFKKEGEASEESEIQFDDVTLKSKTVYGYIYLTMESIESSTNLDSIVRSTFAKAIAEAIDKGFLYGQYNGASYDDFAPKGILNDADILSITSNSTGASYDDIIKAISKVKKQNYNPTTLGINAYTEEILSLLKTNDGQYLDEPKQVQNLNKIVTNQLKHNDSTGDDALVFDPKALLIGIQNHITIKVIEDDKALKNGLIGLRIHAMLDCATVKPKAICKITGIK